MQWLLDLVNKGNFSLFYIRFFRVLSMIVALLVGSGITLAPTTDAYAAAQHLGAFEQIPGISSDHADVDHGSSGGARHPDGPVDNHCVDAHLSTCVPSYGPSSPSIGLFGPSDVLMAHWAETSHGLYEAPFAHELRPPRVLPT